MKTPLENLRVVELGDFISAPYCARLLADAGADVVKVEPPQGDQSRRRGPFPGDENEPNHSGLFLYLNINKRGIILDLDSKSAIDVLSALLQQADVLVENRPSKQMEHLGLDFSTLHQKFPRLIVTSITPFGQTGPYRDYKGDDLISLNMGGLAYATPGLPDHIEDPLKEPPLRPATYMSDFLAGLCGAIGTFMALFSREKDGIGRHVDISQQEVIASMMLWDIAHHSYLRESKKRFPTAQAGVEPNRYMPCKDGYVAIVAFTDEHWRRLVEVMGNPDWAQSTIFDRAFDRAQYWDALGPLLLEWTMSHTAEEITRMAQAKGIPCFRAYELEETLTSEHAQAQGTLVEVKVDESRWKMPGLPFRSITIPRHGFRPAPRLGEHTQEVLHEYLVNRAV